jgi:hypothetical protein
MQAHRLAGGNQPCAGCKACLCGVDCAIALAARYKRAVRRTALEFGHDNLGTHTLKRLLAATFTLLALAACGQPVGDPSYEIIETSGGVVGRLVTLKTTPSLKSGSLADAAQHWQSLGWAKVASDPCKEIGWPAGSPIEAYQIKIGGYAPEKTPTRTLRICATQLSGPKRIAAIGLVVSSEQAQPIKP